MKPKKNYLKKEKRASEAALEKEINIMFELWKKILEDIQKIKNSLIEIDRIALKPRVFTNEEYFKEMTLYEETEKNPGWVNRTEGLKTMRDKDKQINDISKADNFAYLFPQYNKILDKLKDKKPLKGNTSHCILF